MTDLPSINYQCTAMHARWCGGGERVRRRGAAEAVRASAALRRGGLARRSGGFAGESSGVREDTVATWMALRVGGESERKGMGRPAPALRQFSPV